MVPEPHRGTRIVRFGVFEADLHARELRKHGIRIKLQNQSFEVLVVLLERPGEVVTREELYRRLWPGQTFVDFEHNLNTVVKRLRAALSDTAEAPRLIETLARRGYRLFVSVERGDPPEPAASKSGPDCQIGSANALELLPERDTDPARKAASSTQAAVAQRPSIFRFLSWKWLTAAITMTALLGTLIFFHRPPLPPPRVLGYRQITHDGRTKDAGVLATDGARVYFGETLEVGPTLVSVSTSGGETVPIPTPLRGPFLEDISPDGTDLLVTDRGDPAAENFPFYIVGAADSSTRLLRNVVGHCGGWLGDGRIIYEKGNDILVADRDGSESSKVATTPLPSWWPRSSPDGKRIRFALDGWDLWEVNVDGTNLHSLLPGWNSPPRETAGSWTHDGRYFIFESLRKDLMSIWAMRETRVIFHQITREPMQLTRGPMNFTAPVPSRDGNRIFALGRLSRAELWRYDIKTRDLAPYVRGLPAAWIDFSADGKSMAYVDSENSLWRSKPDGSERLRLTFLPMEVVAPHWSPDGKLIAFQAAVPGKGNSNIYLVPTEVGTPERLLPADHDQVLPDWAPDGKRLVFGNNPVGADSSENTELRMFDFDDRHVSSLPGSKGLTNPRWSPDGRYLLGQKLKDHALAVFNLKKRAWSDLVKLGAWSPRWSLDSKSVYFLSAEKAAYNPGGSIDSVYRVRLSDHNVERVMNLKNLRLAWGPDSSFSLAPDDSLILSLDTGAVREIYALDWQAP